MGREMDSRFRGNDDIGNDVMKLGRLNHIGIAVEGLDEVVAIVKGVLA